MARLRRRRGPGVSAAQGSNAAGRDVVNSSAYNIERAYFVTPEALSSVEANPALLSVHSRQDGREDVVVRTPPLTGGPFSRGGSSGGWRSSAVLVFGVLGLALVIAAEPGSARFGVGVACLLVMAERLWTSVRSARRRRSVVLSAERLDVAAAMLLDRLREGYDRQERLLRLHEPVPLRVRWTAGDPEMADQWVNVRQGNREPLDLTGELSEVRGLFERLPLRRLVVLGAPGAGKSVLALRFAREMLPERGAAGPVPVVLRLASWDPRRVGPREWAAGQLASQHPELGSSPAERLNVAGALMATGRILPVLDGFDEIVEVAWERALGELRDGLGRDGRLLLTSRPEAYAAAVTHQPLTAAAVVELLPLSVHELVEFLPRTTRVIARRDTLTTKWEPVLRRLLLLPLSAPDADRAATEAVRTALATPLMVGLARAAYSETSADPVELLDTARFPDHHAIQTHLLDRFVPSVYRGSLDDQRADAPWTSEQAERWARFLARHLQKAGTQELAWWRLDAAVPRLLGCLPLLLTLAVVVGAMCWVGGGTVGAGGFPLWSGFVALTVIGLLAGGMTTGAAELPVPRRLRSPRAWRLWWFPGTLSTPTDTVAAAGPWAVLRQDRRAALATGALWMTSGATPLAIVQLALLALPANQLIWQSGPAEGRTGTWDWAIVLPATAVASWLYGVVLSAWARYALARGWLALTGRLPWRLKAFLNDAHRRGLLRQSGGLYQFRHGELRDRLAGGETRTAPGRSGALRTWIRRTPFLLGRLVNAAAVAALSLWLVVFPLGRVGVPGPYLTMAPACSLLGDAYQGRATPRPTTSPAVTSCEWSVRHADGSSASVDLDVTVHAPAPRRSAPALADDDRPYGRSWPGLGDAAVVTVDDTPIIPDELDVDVWARVGNVVVELGYSEHSSDVHGVTAAAVALTREVLRSGGLTEPSPPGTTALPDALGLFGGGPGRYRDLTARRVAGAVWQDDEPFVIQRLPAIPFAFRGPGLADCRGEVRDPHVSHWDCRSAARAPSADLSMDVMPCGDGPCTRDEIETVTNRLSWPGVKGLSSHTAGEFTGYGEADYTRDPDSLDSGPRKRHTVRMLRICLLDGQYYFIAVALDVDARRPDLAYKTLNDIYTQTWNPRTDGT